MILSLRISTVVAAWVLAFSSYAQIASPPPQTARGPASSQIEKLELHLKKAPDNMQIREALARELLEAKQHEKVIDILNPYTDLISKEALLNLAGAYHEVERFEDEIRILNTLLIKDDKNPELYFILGHAQLSHSKSVGPIAKPTEEARAIAHFRKSIDLNPKYKPSYEILLDTFVTNDNRYEARGILVDMIKHFGHRPEFYNELCRQYSIEGFIEQALSACKKAIQLSPRYPDNYVFMARAYKDQNETQKAGNLLSNAAKRFADSHFLQVAAGDFYQSQKNYPVAARYFERAVALNAKVPEAQIGLARALTETGRFREAYDHYVEACKYDPKTLPEFQEALVRVRQSGESNLETQFGRGIYSCKQ